MAGKLKLSMNQAVEMIMECVSVLMTVQRLCKTRKKLDTLDDLRRDEMIRKEDHYFKVIRSQLKKGDIEKSKSYFEEFINFKLKDREEMLELEQLDDDVMDEELNRYLMGINKFTNEADILENLIIREKLKKIS